MGARMAAERIPLFPLHSVLFPEGPLPLRIFEQRYLTMISQCLKDDTLFGIVLIASGSDTGDVKTVEVGTLARVSDWYQGSDGILGVTAVGVQRFRLHRMARQPGGLYLGEIDRLDGEPAVALPMEFRSMAALLRAVIDDLGKLYAPLDKRYDDATWVGCRFAEVLPISEQDKQYCLELDDPLERLRYVRPLLRAIRQEPAQ